MGQKSICILGMHRSGTSAITRSINLLGAYIGEEADLVPPEDYNPEGFWERSDVVKFHESLQRKFGLSWDFTIPLPEGWHLAEDMAPYREELKGLITRAFAGRPLWAWKDPRTSVFVDIWKEVLKEMGVETVFLHIIRNPIDVVRSFERRKILNRGGMLAVWLNYNCMALRASAGHRRAFLHYDTFMKDWEGELSRCFGELGLDRPADPSAFRAEMGQFIKPGMRHSVSTLEDLRNYGAPRPVVEIYELLEGACSGKTAADGAFDSKVKKIFSEYGEYAFFFSDYMKNLHSRTESLKKNHEALINTREELKKKEAEISAYEAEFRKISRYVDDLEKTCIGEDGG